MVYLLGSEGNNFCTSLVPFGVVWWLWPSFLSLPLYSIFVRKQYIDAGFMK